MVGARQLPCNPDGVCMLCQAKPSEVDCLLVSPQTSAAAMLHWECPHCITADMLGTLCDGEKTELVEENPSLSKDQKQDLMLGHVYDRKGKSYKREEEEVDNSCTGSEKHGDIPGLLPYIADVNEAIDFLKKEENPSWDFNEKDKIIWLLDIGGSSKITGTKVHSEDNSYAIEEGEIVDHHELASLSRSMEIRGVKLRMITVNQLCLAGFNVRLWDEGGEVTRADGSIVEGVKHINGLYFMHLHKNEENSSMPAMNLPGWFIGNVETLSQKKMVKKKNGADC